MQKISEKEILRSTRGAYGVQERNRIQLPLEEIKLAFAASCVEGTARKLHCRRLHHGNAEGIVLREGVIKVLTDIFGY